MKNRSFILLILGIMQIFTAVLMLISSLVPEFAGIRTLGSDLSLYRYLFFSLYLCIAILFLVGAVNKDCRKAALLIACIDLPLELISAWAGLAHLSGAFWFLFASSVIFAVVTIVCFLELKKMIKST
jgi:hypothetical protein